MALLLVGKKLEKKSAQINSKRNICIGFVLFVFLFSFFSFLFFLRKFVQIFSSQQTGTINDYAIVHTDHLLFSNSVSLFINISLFEI